MASEVFAEAGAWIICITDFRVSLIAMVVPVLEILR